MVRSPVEGSMLALVRLEEPVEMTDFVRPICLPENGVETASPNVCNTLGWSRNKDQLQRVHVVASPMNSCENMSIATANGICAEPLYDQDDCDVSYNFFNYLYKSIHSRLVGPVAICAPAKLLT